MEKTNEQTKKEIVIITGGSGFIGKTLIDRLAAHYQIVSLDREDTSANGKYVHIKMDITSADSVRSAIAQIQSDHGSRIASVIHLAAYYDFSGRPSELYDKITVQGTQKLLQALQKLEVKQFIFSSSVLVYAPSRPGQKITEEWLVKPQWAYPESKVRSEKIIGAEKGNIHAVILRIAGVYTDIGNSIPLANQIQRIYENQITARFFPGDMSHGNPFIHRDDLAEAVFKTVENRHTLATNLIINIGEPETLSYEYLQKKIGKLLFGREFKTYSIPKFAAKFGAWIQNLFGDFFIKPWMIDIADDHLELDISKAKTLLNWQPQHSLRETLPKIIGALKSDPEKWYRQNKLKIPVKFNNSPAG